jgi:hypothetical protein
MLGLQLEGIEGKEFAMAWKWFGVKTLTRWEAIGQPQTVDENYDDDSTMLEERVVLIKARTFDEAIRKGEKDANENSSDYRNFYGQTVRLRYLECCDAFELFEEPTQNGVEVFSSIETVSSKVKDSVLIDRKMGTKESIESFTQKREKFWNAELLDKVDNQLTVRKK